MLNIYDAIASIVMSINKEGTALNFIYGSAKEVQQTLIEWSKDPAMKSQKYPCLILFTADCSLVTSTGVNRIKQGYF